MKDQTKENHHNQIIKQKYHHQQQQPQQQLLFSISAQELKEKLDSQFPVIILDVGKKERYAIRHIPGSACAICDETTKNTIMPRLPKDIEIILVSDDEDGSYAKSIASMMRELGGFSNVYYLRDGLNSWTGSFENSVDQDISPLELKHMLEQRNREEEDAGPDDDDHSDDCLMLLDVRTPEEYSEWHIEESVNISLNKLSLKETIERIPKDKQIITICSHGNRSKVAKFILQRFGYRVKSLEGGMAAWTTAFEDTSCNPLLNDDNTSVLVQTRRIGKGCMSYVIAELDGEAAVFDPVFPVEHYMEIAARHGSRITKIYDTHQHADHVSGAKTLSERTGAALFVSAYEGYKSDENDNNQKKSSTINLIYDGDIYHIGKKIALKAIHTPGHTAGSFSFLIGNNNEFLITGDALFIDGIGRPDLRDKAKEFAGALYDTLHTKILSLPEHLLILPAHVERADVAKSGELVTATLGRIRRNQQILLNLSKEDFVSQITSKIMPTPANYKEIVQVNKQMLQIPETTIQAMEIGPNRCSAPHIQQK